MSFSDPRQDPAGFVISLAATMGGVKVFKVAYGRSSKFVNAILKTGGCAFATQSGSKAHCELLKLMSLNPDLTNGLWDKIKKIHLAGGSGGKTKFLVNSEDELRDLMFTALKSDKKVHYVQDAGKYRVEYDFGRVIGGNNLNTNPDKTAVRIVFFRDTGDIATVIPIAASEIKR